MRAAWYSRNGEARDALLVGDRPLPYRALIGNAVVALPG